MSEERKADHPAKAAFIADLRKGIEAGAKYLREYHCDDTPDDWAKVNLSQFCGCSMGVVAAVRGVRPNTLSLGLRGAGFDTSTVYRLSDRARDWPTCLSALEAHPLTKDA